jgi:hypothetical protein
MFDEKTQQRLNSYVYMLLDTDGRPFYIGKGKNNRVFDHASGRIENMGGSEKLDTIRRILDNGQTVRHVILKHGVEEAEAFIVESVLIDTLSYLGFDLKNAVSGHHAAINGLMMADEITRMYNAEPLNKVDENYVIININQKYKRGIAFENIYEATRGWWVIAEWRTKKVQYALSVYKGLVVEVFKIAEWTPDSNKKRWSFTGEIAEAAIRMKYINKSIAHCIRKGSANPIRFGLDSSSS